MLLMIRLIVALLPVSVLNMLNVFVCSCGLVNVMVISESVVGVISVVKVFCSLRVVKSSFCELVRLLSVEVRVKLSRLMMKVCLWLV